MKKLFIIALLFTIFSASVFSEPFYDYKKMDEFIFLTKDNQTCYKIVTLCSSSHYGLHFQRKSLINDVTVYINIDFENEQQLQKYVNTINLGEVDLEFDFFLKLLIMANIQPVNNLDEENKSLVYRAYISSSGNFK